MHESRSELPAVLSADALAQYLDSTSSLMSRAAPTAYVAQRRASEFARLRIGDTDSARRVIQVRDSNEAASQREAVAPTSARYECLLEAKVSMSDVRIML